MRDKDKRPMIAVDDVVEIIAKCSIEFQKQAYRELALFLAEHDPQPDKPLTFVQLDQQLKMYCRQFLLTVEAVKSRNQRPKVVQVRRLVARKAKKLGYSYPQIGKYFGLHHSTIQHLCKSEGWKEAQ